MVGGISITGKYCWASFFSRLLRRRCDRRGFERSTIEIIAQRRVALAFEPQKKVKTGHDTGSGPRPPFTCAKLLLLRK
jgi:hypothetical protein